MSDKKKLAIAWVSIAVFIIVGVFGLFLFRAKVSVDEYNDGKCEVCESGEYKYVDSFAVRSTPIYNYQCDKCGHMVQTYAIME